MDQAGYRQTVLVLSDPPGAKVYNNGRFIGVAPNYMRLRRERHPVLKFEGVNGETREITVETRYRWVESFGMNALLLNYMPIGWGVDLVTGTAWDAEDPPLQVFGEGGQWPGAMRPARIAVAPPEGVDAVTADALGMALEERLRRVEPFEVVPYDETSSSFQFYRSYQGLAEDKEDRYPLFSTIKVDHVLESKATKHGDSFLVKAELKDVITTKTKAVYSWEVTPGTESLRREFTAESFINEYFHLLPSTVFLNFAAYTPTVKANGIPYKGKEAPAQGPGDQIMRYLSALSLAGLERERFNTRGHFTFSFVPTAIVSQKEIILPTYGAVNDSSFHRWYLSAGYGIEGGYMGRYGLVYADLIPMMTWSSIHYANPYDDGTVSRFSLQAMIEAGYSYFFTNHFIARVYFRQVGEDNRLWNQALAQAAATPQITNEVSSGFLGVSLGYYVPSGSPSRGGWLIKRK